MANREGLRHEWDGCISSPRCKHCDELPAHGLCPARVSAALDEASARAESEAEALQDTIDTWEDRCHSLRSMLRRLEWGECSAHPDRLPVCWCCDGDEPEHAPDCDLAALLR